MELDELVVLVPCGDYVLWCVAGFNVLLADSICISGRVFNVHCSTGAEKRLFMIHNKWGL